MLFELVVSFTGCVISCGSKTRETLADGVCTEDVRTCCSVSFVHVISVTVDVVTEGDLSVV